MVILDFMKKALKKNGYLILIYAILVFSGGLMGYILKKSLPSLLSGGFFGLALLWASVLQFNMKKWGIYLSFSLLFALEIFFSIRFILTESFFPSGLMLILTSIWIILLVVSLISGARRDGVEKA